MCFRSSTRATAGSRLRTALLCWLTPLDIKHNLYHVGLVKCRALCHPVLFGQTHSFVWDTYQTLIIQIYKNSHEIPVELIYEQSPSIRRTLLCTSRFSLHERVIARTQMTRSGLLLLSPFPKVTWLLLNTICRRSRHSCPLTMLDLVTRKPMKPALPTILSPIPQTT